MRGSRSLASPSSLIAMASVVAVVAGCGGHSVDRADLLPRANAICFTAQQTLRSVPTPTGGGEMLAAYLQKITPIVAREARQLQALPRPSARRQQLDRFIAATATTAGDYRAAARAASAGDDDGVQQALARLRASPAADYARAYGLTQCGGNASPSS